MTDLLNQMATASETPRTDAHYGRLPNGRQVRGTVQDYEHARKLEVELADAHHAIEDFAELNRITNEELAALRKAFDKPQETAGEMCVRLAEEAELQLASDLIREECAQICYVMFENTDGPYSSGAFDCAAAIRAEIAKRAK